MIKQVALYARVSTEEQATGQQVSIKQQVADMRALCQRSDWDILCNFVDAENYEATQSPGKGKMVNPSGERADRPAFLEMLEAIKDGDVDAVVCWRDDRLVRHPRVAVALEDGLDIGDSQRRGRDKIQVFDATGATIDRFTLSIKATIWREENKRRVERSRMGKIATLQQGRWPAAYTRFGYQTLREEGKRGFEIVMGDEEDVRTVKDMFAWCDGGDSLRTIRRKLIERDAKQKGFQERKHQWPITVISQILHSEVYTGELVWRFTDGTTYSVEVPQIISPEQYKRVQEQLERNKWLCKRNSKGVYLLQSLLVCGECDLRVQVRASSRRWQRLANGDWKRYDRAMPLHQYYCPSKSRYPDEPHPTPHLWGGPTLDWEVWRYIVDNGIRHPKTIRTQVLARQEELKAQGENVDGDIAHAQRKISDVDQERVFYQRQAARGKMTEAEFDARMEETEHARQYWQAELVRLKELRDDAEKVQSGLDYAEELLTTLQARLPYIDQPSDKLHKLAVDKRIEILEERQKIIRALCDEVIIWADGEVKLIGVLDGSEVAKFELGRSRGT